jgi:hypothetical protein
MAMPAGAGAAFIGNHERRRARLSNKEKFA